MGSTKTSWTAVLLDTEVSANMENFSLSFSKALMTTLNYMLTATGLNIQLGAAVEFVASSSPSYSAVVAVIKAGGTESDVRLTVDEGRVPPLATAQAVAIPADESESDASESRLIDVEIGYQNIYGGYAGQTKDGDFDVFGDEAFLASFESYETALDYAKGVAHRYDQMSVEDADGEVLATLNDDGLFEHVAQVDDGEELDHGFRHDEENTTFDVYGDGAFVQEFPTEEAAVDFVAQEIRRHRAFEVRQGEEVVRTIRGLLDLYMVVVDGKAHDGFYSLPVAKGEAIGLFASDMRCSVTVLGLEGDVLLDLAG